MKQFLGFLPLNVGLNILVASYIVSLNEIFLDIYLFIFNISILNI